MALYGIIDKYTGKLQDAGTREEMDDKLNDKKTKEIIRNSYYDIKELLEEYIDHKEEFHLINTLWILGTDLHEFV